MNETPEAGGAEKSGPDIMDFLSGLFLGLLIGALIGISVSPLTGDLLAGLVALLATFFGLAGRIPGTAPLGRAKLLAFCLGVLIGLPGAIHVRTHAWLAPSLEQRIEDYTTAGLEEPLARDIAIYERTGLRLGALAAAPEPGKPLPAVQPYTFSRSASQASCGALLGERYSSARGRLDAMTKHGPPWQEAGTFGLALPGAQQAGFADYMHALLCNGTE